MKILKKKFGLLHNRHSSPPGTKGGFRPEQKTSPVPAKLSPEHLKKKKSPEL